MEQWNVPTVFHPFYGLFHLRSVMRSAPKPYWPMLSGLLFQPCSVWRSGFQGVCSAFHSLRGGTVEHFFGVACSFNQPYFPSLFQAAVYRRKTNVQFLGDVTLRKPKSVKFDYLLKVGVFKVTRSPESGSVVCF